MPGKGSRPRTYQYVEGGGPNPPFGEDPFQRIVNVHWRTAAGVFVCGDFNGVVRYTKDTTSDWQIVASFLPPGETAIHAEANAASYAKVNEKPTFLVGGNNDYGQGEGWSGIVMLSNDGLHWKTVLTVWEENSNNTSVLGLVWDTEEKAFYADVDVRASTVGDFARRLYRSPDGHEWTRIDIGTPPVYYNDVFRSHCKGVNGAFVGTADGIYGYDAVNNVLINGTGDQVAIHGGDFVSTGLDVNNAVAYAGGIWFSAGGATDSVTGNDIAATAVSTDSGVTWTVVAAGAQADDNILQTVVGAPIGDFR